MAADFYGQNGVAIMNELPEHSWEIDSFDGIGVLRFGQTREDVLARLGEPSKTFKKVPFAATESDAYQHLGLHIHYDPEFRVESVDAMEPCPISFRDTALLDQRIGNVVQELEKWGYQHDSFTYNDAGFSLLVADGIVKGVTLFPRGYFDLRNPNSPASRAAAAAAAWRQATREQT